MSFFKWFKSSATNIESELEEIYSQMLAQLPTGITLKQAHKEVKEAIKACKEQALRERTANLKPDFGDFLIKAAASGEESAKRIVNKASKDGATEEDICELWNMNDLQRRMIDWAENTFRYATFLDLKENGLSSDEAMVQVRKIFPMYGDPDDTKHTSGDDRPLSPALRNRVDAFREKKGALYIKTKVEGYTSYNAYIRNEIRIGNL